MRALSVVAELFVNVSLKGAMKTFNWPFMLNLLINSCIYFSLQGIKHVNRPAVAMFLLNSVLVQKPKKYFAISRKPARSSSTGNRQSGGRILFREKPNGTIHWTLVRGAKFLLVPCRKVIYVFIAWMFALLRWWYGSKIIRVPHYYANAIQLVNEEMTGS